MADDELAPGDCWIEWADGGIVRDARGRRSVSMKLSRRYLDEGPQHARRKGNSGDDDNERHTARSRFPISKWRRVRPCRRRLDCARSTAATVNARRRDLEAVFDVPVQVRRSWANPHGSQPAAKLGPGTVVELDRKVGEAIDIYVNDRLVARGEVVLVEDRLGITMTEIIKSDQAYATMIRRHRMTGSKASMRLLIFGTLGVNSLRRQRSPWIRAPRSRTPTASSRRLPCCAWPRRRSHDGRRRLDIGLLVRCWRRNASTCR